MSVVSLRAAATILLLSAPVLGSGCAVGHPDPCDIVLQRDAGERPDAPEIRRIKERTRVASNPLPYLERLGWTWIGREAIDHDHSYFDLALQAAACMERRAPGNPDARLLRAHALVSMHRFSEGEAVARDLAARSPSWLAWAVLGDALMEQGSLEEAAIHYQRMADDNPGSQSWSRAAHLRWLLGDRDGAMEAMARAAQAADPRDARGAAWYRARLAHYAIEAGRPDEARRFADAALALVPDHPPALHARGMLALAEQRSQDAVAPLRAAVAADPLPAYLWTLYEALIESGLEAEAMDVETRLLADGCGEDPRSVALYLAASGRDLERTVRLALAELDVRQDPLTLDAVAAALAAAGRIDEARGYSRRALAHGTRAPRLALHAAAIAAASGDACEAVERIEDATAMASGLLPSERRHLESLRVATARRHPPAG